MVMNWKDAQGEPVLVGWKQSLNQERQDYKQAKMSKDQLAVTEERIIRELSQRIRKEIGVKDKFFQLGDVIKRKLAQCLGHTLLFYILGNSVGLSAKAIDVEELFTGEPAQDPGHVANIVRLASGGTTIVDLALGLKISKSFKLEDEFAKVDNYWELNNKLNPLGIHRRIQILDRDGLIAIIFSNRGNDYTRLDEHKKAISAFNKAIELDPKLSDAYSNRAGVLLKLGQYSKAISDCAKAIKLDPKNTVAYCNRGGVYVKLDEVSKALSDLNKAIELNPKYAKA